MSTDEPIVTLTTREETDKLGQPRLTIHVSLFGTTDKDRRARITFDSPENPTLLPVQLAEEIREAITLLAEVLSQLPAPPPYDYSVTDFSVSQGDRD